MQVEFSNYNNIAIVNDTYRLQNEIINAHYNKLYQTKIELYEELIDFQKYLQSNGQSTIYDKAELELQLTICQATIKACDIEVDHIIDHNAYISNQIIFTDNIIESLLVSNHIINESTIEGELISNEAESINYWKNAKVAPYARIQHYSDATFVGENRVVGQIGVGFTLPLTSDSKQKKLETEARATIHNNYREQQYNSIKSELELIAREINNNLHLLNITAKVIETHISKIETAKKMYQSDQLPLQKLAMQYLTLLNSQTKFMDLVYERETLKTKLLILNNRN
ncbi:MAG: hypothetical protein R3Y59_06925 [bacterium]